MAARGGHSRFRPDAAPPWAPRVPMTQPPDPGDAGRRRALAALLFLAVLVGACVWLAGVLRRESVREDCWASGRRDCDAATSSP